MIIEIPAMLPRPDRTLQFAPEIYGNDVRTWRTTYTDKQPGMPQLLLVEQPDPGATLLPHYHASDQFQVFMDGGAMLGKHKVTPVSIHYTNQFTGYGPIVGGDRGVNYYVLRPAFDPLGPGQYIHDLAKREAVKAYTGKRRTLMADGIAIRPATQLQSLGEAQVALLFQVADTEPDPGTCAADVALGPGMRYTGPAPASGGGQVVLVLEGELQGRTGRLGPRGAIAVTRDEQALTVQAGAAGAQFLLLQYPRRD